MNVIEALKQKRNLRRPVPSHMGSNGDGWLDWRYVLAQLSENNRYGGIPEGDVMAEDWEVQTSAGERLQNRIHEMICNTGLHPTVLDVSEADYREIEGETFRRGGRGLGWNQLVVYMSHKGPTRIVKARK